MGVKWDLGWNPKYEKSVEIMSTWGNSECSEEEGNLTPIRYGRGEAKGQHVIDALRKGYRLGFIGSGDIHDGRPGDSLHQYQPMYEYTFFYPQGFCAACSPKLDRKSIYDTISDRYTYTSNDRRIYLDMSVDEAPYGSEVSAAPSHEVAISVASSQPLTVVELIGDKGIIHSFALPNDKRILNVKEKIKIASPFCYLRVSNRNGGLALASPVFFK